MNTPTGTEKEERPDRSAVGDRITGLDLARALAIFGMFMAHIGPRVPAGLIPPDTEWLNAVYRVVHGRSAILFGVLAGIGVAILASRSLSSRDTDLKLVWRSIVLFVIGIWLQTLDMPVAIILHYYAILFLLGILANRWGDRLLLIVSLGALIFGPVALLGMHTLAPDLTRTLPDWYRIDQQFFFILIAGYYPVLTWTSPFLFGMWLGRRDMSTVESSRGLMVGGAFVTTAAYGISVLATSWAGEPTSQGDWRNLVTIEPHNQMPLWLVSATGIAIFVIGVSLYLTRHLPQLTKPLVLVGQMAFTVYVAQIIFLTLAPELVIATDSYGAAWASIGRMAGGTILVVVAYRALLPRGPLEWLVRAPWSIPGSSPLEKPP
ncbi:MAG: DUF1624 domain-containing protein [Acidimicrobiia bacterium]|nr:DUF1624 domain-containing protein [Acidimicrobiia bacterium]